jgi:hypothetical protein
MQSLILNLYFPAASAVSNYVFQLLTKNLKPPVLFVAQRISVTADKLLEAFKYEDLLKRRRENMTKRINEKGERNL